MSGSSEERAWLARRDGSAVIGYGPFVESAVPAGALSFYVQDFQLSGRKPWKIPSRFDRIAAAALPTHLGEPRAMDCVWDAPDAGPFATVFQELTTAIHEGVFEKTVPVVTETGRMANDPAVAIGVAMARQQAPLQSYGWHRGQSGFAGATPELLFSLEGNRLETMALAGTARSEDREVFAVDEKEIREHEYVARALAAKLLDLGSTVVQKRKILELESLVHFLTGIFTDLESPILPEDLIQRLHPTPALGPLPRTGKTLALLSGWRKRLGCPDEFGAPFGLLDGDRFEAVVAIRGIWWNGPNLKLPAGCGVIEASRLVSEWRELRLKREAVKRYL